MSMPLIDFEFHIRVNILKVIYSEKVTKFYEISTNYLTDST